VVRHPLVQRLVNAYASRDADRVAPAGNRRLDGSNANRTTTTHREQR
jgi:hypothetical protein